MENMAPLFILHFNFEIEILSTLERGTILKDLI